MKRKVSISIGMLQSIYGDEKALEIAAQIGADAVDFDLSDAKWDYRNTESIYNRSDSEIMAYFNGLYEKAKSLGIEIGQTHGRLRIYYNNPKEDAAALENARRDCLATSALRARYCVMHPVATTIMGPDADPQLMRDLCFQTFHQILVYARQYDVQIVAETLGDSPKYQCCDFFGKAEEFKQIYDRICAEGDNGKYFSVCIDTGHCNKAMRFGNLPAQDVIRLMGEHITCLHLNDNDTLTDQHKIPMTGTMNWKEIFDALDEVGYHGNYNIELNLKHFGEGFEIETADFAVKVMKFLLHQRLT